MYMLKDRHGTFYLRILLDKEQRQRLGKGEHRRSLRTKSLRTAKQRLPEAYVKACRDLGWSSEGEPVDTTPRVSVFFDQYTKHLERTDIRPKSIEDKRIILNLLVYIVGDKPISQYTREDAVMFKNTALELPPRVSVLINKGLSLKDIQKTTTKRVTVSTVNNWVRNLSAMFDFAQKEGRIDKNHFKGLSIKQKIKSSTLRDAFTPSEVNTVIDYVQDNIKGSSKYWITLIGAYSGMRLGEICQLYRENVIQVDNIWCFYVTADREDQSIKNLSSERLVPIHQYLLDMGILTFIQSKDDRLFPDLRYTQYNGYRSGVSKWFSNLVTNLGIKTDNKLSFHSFRHYFATELKQKGIEESLAASLLGHMKQQSITYTRYGKSYLVSTLKEVIDLI